VPTQLQLEGRELEPLLDRVRHELGPQARILSAEKVRSGGIGGFFARQRFELTVELDDLPAEPPCAESPSAEAPAAEPPAATAGGSPDALAAPASLLELADRVSDHEHAAAVSTETPSFTSLLSRLGVSMDGSPSVPVLGPVPAAALPAGALPVSVPGPRHPTGSTVTTAVPVVRSVPQGWSARSVAAPDVLPPTTTTAVTLPQPMTAPTGHGRSTELTRLGLPAHLQPVESDEPDYPALLQSLHRLPKAPRTTNRAGEVLAVVGPLDLALDVAREMALDLELPLASAVFVATSAPVDSGVAARQRVQDVNTARAYRATWRQDRPLTVVAIDAPLTSAGAAQARAYLGAFGPTAVWGVVEATRKAHDVGTWARAVGGVHALALTGVQDTSDPAAILALGIPVGRLDGRPASAAVWAGLLTGRLVS